MVKIVIENLGKKEVAVKDFSLPVIEHLHNQKIDWMHACGKKGRCTTCKMIVVAGFENLSPLSPAEQKYQSIGALVKTERLACQATMSGDITVRVPEEFKLPHLHYTA